MGLFGGKKTFVSSVVYNMAGDPLERSNFLKTAVMGNVILNNKISMGENLRTNYLRGPGIRLRSFFRWAQNNYDLIGVPTGTLGGIMDMDRATIAGQITPDPGKTIEIQVAEAGVADYSYWAEQYMFENHIDLIETDWVSDIDNTTLDITITFADTTTVTFSPSDFQKDKAYLYVVYSQSGGSYSSVPVVGDTIILDPLDSFPDTTGWTLVSDTTVEEAPDSRQIEVWHRVDYMGQYPDPEVDKLYSLDQTLTLTTLTNPSDEVVERTSQLTTFDDIHYDLGSPQMMIYRIGSGNAVLDNLVIDEITDGEYLPFIPLRVNNQFLSETYHPELYNVCKKAYKKATGGAKYDTLVDQIADNEKIGDIDYAYVMYGVSLNILDNAGREYIYRFFEKLMGQQTSSNLEYLLWRDERDLYEAQMAEYIAWKDAQSEPTHALFGTVFSGTTPARIQPGNTINIGSNGTGALNTNINLNISWDTITKSTGSGLKKPSAKKGDYWLTVGESETGTVDTVSTGKSSVFVTFLRKIHNTISIHHQISDDEWETLTVVGAKHTNIIYNGKAVTTFAAEALDDIDESGFVLPLHYATYREMSLVNSTQLATNCAYILFNCYKVVKLKWYQTGIFKIVVFILIIAVSIAFPPAAGASGILGSSAAIGASLGLTGVMGLIVGAIVNAIAAMIVLRIISAASIAVFGEKLGAIIGAIAGAIAITMGGNIMNGQSMSSAWGDMMSAQNILVLTNAAGQGIAGYINASTMDVVKKTEQVLADYEKESKTLTQKFIDELGYDHGSFDPIMLTDSFIQAVSENSEAFLSRTLMTGSDIAEMSMDMLTNFADYTLSLDPSRQ